MSASIDQEAKLHRNTSPASSRMIALINSKNPLPLLSLIQSPALRRNAPINTLLARKTLNAFLPSKTAIRSVEANNHVGLFVYQEKEAKPQSTLPNALLPTDAMASQLNKFPLLSLSVIPNNASKRNAPINGLPAKKTPNAFPLSKIARRNVEPVNPAGLFASPQRAAKPQSMSLSALMPINASA